VPEFIDDWKLDPVAFKLNRSRHLPAWIASADVAAPAADTTGGRPRPRVRNDLAASRGQAEPLGPCIEIRFA